MVIFFSFIFKILNMKNLFLFLLSISFVSKNIAQNKNEKEIRSILNQQNIAWNKGNLDSFMVGYWQNDSLLFIGKSGTTFGYNKTLQNYKNGYPDATHMGIFTSNIISIKKLSNEYYFVIGKWVLTRSIGNISGYYSLLFKKIKQQWKIIVDHSS